MSILVLSSFLRLGMVDMIEGTVPIRNDAKEYYSYAANIKSSGIYSSMLPPELTDTEITVTPDATRPPGYAMFLYPFVTVPPTVEMVYSIRVAQVILSTLTVLLSFLVLREFLSNAWALGASFLVGLSPHLVAMNIYLLTESLFTFLLMLFAYLTIQGFARQSVVLSIIAGITLGLTLLTKSSIIYFPYLMLAFFIVKYRFTLSNRILLLFILGFVLVPGIVKRAGNP
ncbi:MAG: glycosyltransferase family 39 protein [Gammaproteobacteria bacterium]|nr:glycosyltransferase family 39 protein [Gammaproteobacteria bacterium]